MTKGGLIFDWKRSETRGRDRLFAFAVVAVSFAVFAGFLDVSMPTLHNGSAQAAGLVRFADKSMARSWLLEAEENGPFPGRLRVYDEGVVAMVSDGENPDAWTDYSPSLRLLPGNETVNPAQITPKGIRVFPEVPSILPEVPSGDVPRGEMQRTPVLIPYDKASLAWMPEQTTDIALPAGMEFPPDSLRFAISLREDGSVAEAIPLGGGDAPSQEALENWLRGLRFGKGTGERWFGLRVEFVNRRDDDTEPE